MRKRHNEENQLQQLLRETKWKFASAVAMLSSTLEDGSEEGVGVLSKYPILELAEHRLRHFPGACGRVNSE